MSELLWRGWNVAIPQVDVGDDIFVVKDEEGTFYRVQVKTANGTHRRYGCSGQYTLPLQQLRTPQTPDLIYILAVRYEEEWADYLILSRQALLFQHETAGIGTPSQSGITLTIQFRPQTVTCSGSDLSKFRNNWDQFFPFVSH